MKKATILAALVVLMASCSKIKNERQCYTCSYKNSLQTEDFCGNEAELKQYTEFKARKGKPVTCN